MLCMVSAFIHILFCCECSLSERRSSWPKSRDFLVSSGFFKPGFPKLKRFNDHHEVVLRKFLPKIKKHMVSGNHLQERKIKRGEFTRNTLQKKPVQFRQDSW